jgi:hypothetical protein
VAMRMYKSVKSVRPYGVRSGGSRLNAGSYETVAVPKVYLFGCLDAWALCGTGGYGREIDFLQI